MQPASLPKQHWIGAGTPTASPQFRREFECDRPLAGAMLLISGLGYHDAWLNGNPVGDHVLDPSQTDYELRVFYVRHDVTDLVGEGRNTLGVILGNGWYNQDRVWAENGLSYGQPRLMAELHLNYADGTAAIIRADADWHWAPGPITDNNIYAGECYDARLETDGWCRPGFDDSAWQAAMPMDPPGGELQEQTMPPMRRIEGLRPVKIRQFENGSHVVDFGQNFSGWARIQVNAPAGTEITLRYAETVFPDGGIDTASTGVFATKVEQIDRYICRGAPTPRQAGVTSAGGECEGTFNMAATRRWRSTRPSRTEKRDFDGATDQPSPISPQRPVGLPNDNHSTINHSPLAPDTRTHHSSFGPAATCPPPPRYPLPATCSSLFGTAEIWEPRFTYHGFRYVEVTGWPGELTPEQITGIVVHNDLPVAGQFECSDERLNQLHRMALWTHRGNMHGLPEDCPARERCGWLGDANLVAEYSLWNFDAKTFWEKFLDDIETTRAGNAGVPCNIAPGKRCTGSNANPDWAAAFIMVTWYVYQFSGDKDVIRRHWDGMSRLMQHFRDTAMTNSNSDRPKGLHSRRMRSRDHFRHGNSNPDPSDPSVNRNNDKARDKTNDKDCANGSHRTRPSHSSLQFSAIAENWILPGGYGDFFDPGTDAIVQHTPPTLTSTLWFHRCADVMARMAGALGNTNSAEKYRLWQENISAAVTSRFFDSDLGSFGSQAANAMALAFDVLPEEEERILEALVADIRERDNHMNVGVMGVRFILEALTEHGHGELALALMRQESYPSFGHLIERGATTLWECWGEAGHDGTHGPRSLNHPFMGGYDNWFFNTLAGIRPDPAVPGFQHFFLAPNPIEGLSWVQCHYDCPQGRIESNWRLDKGKFIWDIVVPGGTSATAMRPYCQECLQLKPGHYQFSETIT